MFDSVIAVDWTGARPSQGKLLYSHSISVAMAEENELVLLKNKQHAQGIWSRTDFFDFLCDLIDHTQKRIFIGFDAHFSFPEFMVSDHVQDMWKVVDDICQDQNDFYAGSFPTAEPYSEYYMRSKNDIGRKYQGHFRACEAYSAEYKIAQPENIFKLIGPKQVGKAGLSSMRFLYALKQKFGDKIAIWPFEETVGKQIVIGEIFSRIFIKNAHLGAQKLNRDTIHQALAFYNFTYGGGGDLTDHDTDALISAAGLSALKGDVLNIPSQVDRNIVQKEGWIAGLF